jgi:hypothetical protein
MESEPVSEPAAPAEASAELGGEASAPEETTPAAAPSPGGGDDSRDTESIANEVKLHRDQARACYDRIGKAKKLPKGDLVIAFTLNPDGSVKETSLNEQRSTLKDPDLVKCVGDVIKKIKFPGSSKGMETAVNYPFNFNPR